MKWETALWMVVCLLLASLPRGLTTASESCMATFIFSKMENCPFHVPSLLGQLDTTCHAFVGETVVLPCTINPPGELTLSSSILYWQIGTKRLVHFFQDGQDFPERQDEEFRGRTSLFLDQLKDGNLSLKISNVQLGDDAEYSCIYRQTESHQTKKSTIKLNVSVPPTTEEPPSLSEQNQIPSRGLMNVSGLAMLALSFLVLDPLGILHL